MTGLFDLILRAAFSGALLALVYTRLKLFLLYFQQEEYDDARFLRWLRAAKGVDRRLSLILLAMGLLAAVLPAGGALLALAGGIAGSIHAVYRDQRFLAEARKPLVLTQRANRILRTALGFAALLLLALMLLTAGAGPQLLGAILLVQITPLLLPLANRALAPYEARVQRGFLDEAREKLRKLDPYIVGITGSYGKTSTKLILQHILSTLSQSLATPGSVNTLMGISRIVREQLKPEHRTFVVEMGAYGPGSIARLCDLAPPRLSLLTAVGWAHYERFKTIDTVFRAKMEIAEATRARAGKTIVNVDQVPEALLRAEIERAGRAGFLLVGRAGGPFQLDVTIEAARQTQEGIVLTLAFGAERSEVLVSLFGLHQAANAALAIAAARELGLPMEAIRAALRSVPQVKHRLEVTRGRPVIIDDGYNSNPEGFRSALDLLDLFGESTQGARRILITPGMVELGAAHDEAHREIGAYAAPRTDIVLALGPARLAGFLQGLKAGDRVPEIVELSTQAEAEAWLKANARPEDIVLFENSLPDLYERPLRL
ncbi:MAG: UDP-N-acetylmuramoyl-tripeptide--D-alanyl-D-alanine ligase [Alphaproteobacteria bacterium]|nr:UDP-N-acetylmuramoyl-tripeptide--D-alanyl-D-alanine ligase [Alphaproteobacteria bacterium]